ncbi:phosphomevalonate kinase family protein [Streptococcus constellatus subsp. pharyngis SK1060 = CCUG 46377]|uniref:Phosphomevalonate kinase family protein n=1 Tax=Streptococcus constellatus subsp. pharyngis SK1060 = CCUG 46377 TaxID=1035184 RepID=F9PAK9_STRCV|nr:phosphomevalonate kinase family protein [Streptococcus constellatus subsp. pharyngis SK1060 = CCUG 46377]
MFDVPLSADETFKLAAYVLLKRGDNGSMGDVACIAYEDLIYYQSFNRKK